VEPEFLQNRFGIANQGFVLLITFFRVGKFEKLDFLELMLTENAARIFTGGEVLFAKAGGVGSVIELQLRAVVHFGFVESGQRHFGGGHHPGIAPDIVIQVFAELGQLPRAEHDFFFDHEGRIKLAIALRDVEIEQPLNEGALKLRPRAAQDVKATACELDAALEIEKAEFRSEFPVGEGRKRKFLRLAHLPASVCSQFCGKYLKYPAAESRRLLPSLTMASLTRHMTSAPASKAQATLACWGDIHGDNRCLNGGASSSVAARISPIAISQPPSAALTHSGWGSIAQIRAAASGAGPSAAIRPAPVRHEAVKPSCRSHATAGWTAAGSGPKSAE